MIKIKVVLQNNNKFHETELDADVFNATELYKEIEACQSTLVPIGNIIVNKHHIESIHEIKEEVVEDK